MLEHEICEIEVRFYKIFSPKWGESEKFFGVEKIYEELRKLGGGNVSKSKSMKESEVEPYIGNLYGFNHEFLSKNYELNIDITEMSHELNRLKFDIEEFIDSFDKLHDLIQYKENQIEGAESNINSFDFSDIDTVRTKKIVQELEHKVSELNMERYHVSKEIKKIEDSIEKDIIKLKPENLEQVYKEAGIVFPGQITARYQDLIDFNKSISQERNKILKLELKDLKLELDSIREQLTQANQSLKENLSLVKESNSIEKYKGAQTSLTKLKAELINLQEKAIKLNNYNQNKLRLEKAKDFKKECFKKIKEDVNENVHHKDSRYNQIKKYFSEIISLNLNKLAVIDTKQNTEGNLDFTISILDDSGQQTNESDGHTYKKFMCMAFDISVNLVYLKEKYPHFIYHDGVFDNMDIRKKRNFIEYCKEISKTGLQYIITFIDSDLPDSYEDHFTDDDLLLELDDSGDQGRLFKMAPF